MDKSYHVVLIGGYFIIGELIEDGKKLLKPRMMVNLPDGRVNMAPIPGIPHFMRILKADAISLLPKARKELIAKYEEITSDTVDPVAPEDNLINEYCSCSIYS